MSRAGLPTWTPVASDLRFARAYHTCTPLRGKLHLYGGMRSADHKEPPLGDIVTFDPAQNAVESGPPGGPYRQSHHDAVAIGNKWLCVVGGWDGSQRLSSVLSYDIESGEWASWAEEPHSRPPAGLSSHTCTKISDRELCVVGREGGLRTQRRYASVYTLQVKTGAKTYRYKEEESRAASRSGHSAALLQSDGQHGSRAGWSLYVFGGRESATVDVVGHWKAGTIQEDTATCSSLLEKFSQLVASEKAKREAPKSLRHHSCSVIGPFLVVFGGETLSRSRDAVCNDLYVCDTRYNPMSWFRFPGSDPVHKRVGHRTCLLNDRLYLVGGFSADGKTPCPEIYVLDFL
ncbi:kelch domain-containing protein 9 [Bufo gargarizans]|uniref:kelch domain-containing protein 9 n=1 Tax=Bufo gargarizans TaxID=30331 RepID=UPI001CF23495|nr:kelch domain-containing protein 9 [Bufo gargarizans]XP_044128432.1 kelch domain-containing protein 9 [Bufo gargarizans]